MNREIRFRVWSFDTERFEKDLDLYLGLNGFVYERFLGNGCSEIALFKAAEVNQYSGLKDSKNKEIYEGDIIKAKIGAIDFILKIEFEHGKFMAVGDDDLTAFDLFTITDKCEVIGNIYENKDFGLNE